MSCLHEIERSVFSHNDRMPVLNDERAADRGCGIRNDIDHLLRSASRIRRIGENNIKKEARSHGAIEKPKSVPDAHLRTIETEPAKRSRMAAPVMSAPRVSKREPFTT